MAAAFVTFSLAGIVTEFRSNSSGCHVGLHFMKAVQDSQLLVKAGVNSVDLRPEAKEITQSCRRMKASKLFLTPKALSMGSRSMQKLSGQNGFNWPIYAVGQDLRETGRGIEPEETCDHHDHEDMENAPASIKDKLILELFTKHKLKIYKEYIENHFSDGDASAEARYQAEREKELKEKNGMLDLEEMYPKSEVDQARDWEDLAEEFKDLKTSWNLNVTAKHKPKPRLLMCLIICFTVSSC